MTQQLIHIFKTYLTRKLFWLLAFLYAQIIWCETSVPIRQTPLLWSETQVRWLPQKEFDGVTAFLDWPASDDELRELRGLKINGHFVVKSDQLGPNGRPAATLERDHTVLPEHLAKLEKCVQLKELRLISVELTPELGQTLAKLPQLRQLELNLIGSPIPSLANLPALPELQIFQVPVIPPAELGMLAKHPRLRTIELHESIAQGPIPGTLNTTPFEIWQQPSTLPLATQIERVIIHPNREYDKAIREGIPHHKIPTEAHFKGIPISESLVSELAKLPNLEAVEVRDPRGGWPSRAIDDPGLRQALAGRPNVAFNPMIRHAESLLSPFAAFSSMLLLVVLGIQLLSHFATSWSLTVPKFSAPHLIVAALLLIIHVSILTTIMMIRRDMALLPAMAIVLGIPAVAILLASILAYRPATFPLMFPLTFAGIMGIFIIGPAFVHFLGDGEFFDGHRPGHALAILVCEIAVIVWASRSFTQLPRRFSEAGIPVGLGFTQTLQQIQMRKLSQRSQSDSAEQRKPRFFERRVETFLSSKKSVIAAQQWRVAEASNGTSIVTMCLLGPWMLVGVFTLVFSLMSGQAIAVKLLVFHSVLFGTLSLTMTTFILAIGALGRRPILQQELLRPMLRSEMIQHLRSSMWLDLRPAVVITFGYLLALSFLHSWGPSGWSSQPRYAVLFSHAILVLALPLPIWGGMQFLLSIRSETWRGFASILLYLLLIIVIQIIAIPKVLPGSYMNQAATIATLISNALAGICVLLGLGLAWWGNRCLPKVEWGATG